MFTRTLIMSLGLVFTCIASAGVGEILSPSSGSVFFVAKTGKNSQPGTKEKPFKNIDKALKVAKAGDTIAVAAGNYSGTFGIGYFEAKNPVKLYGSFNPDFSARNVAKYATSIAPPNKSGAKSRKPLLTFSKSIAGAVVDGFVFDMGERNSYHATKAKPDGVDSGMLLLPPAKATGEVPTVTQPILKVPSAAKGGDMIIRNNVFANGANFAIQAGLRSGMMLIENNVFVANRMAAIEVYGTCPGSAKTIKTPCGVADIGHNTVLFTWSRLDDMMDMGYGVRVMTKLEYKIHDNLIGGNVLGGIDNTRFNKDEWIHLDRNVFFANKKADLKYSPESNTDLELRVAEFEDLPFASVADNKEGLPGKMPVNAAYLDGFANATYKEETSLDRDSPINQWRSVLGMNLIGKIDSDVSMFANRYPRDEAIALFGVIARVGAQGF